MNLIFTCGGTAGHINPAIAVANEMVKRYPDANILFIGAEGKMEEKLVPQAGYELKSLPASGLSRKLNMKGIKQNFYAVKCVLGAVGACKKIYREFKPDAVIGTGGYASFPALYAAQTMGIPTCVHEANALPGVTTKLAANKADRVLVAFEESRQYYKKPDEVRVVGMPIKKEFTETTREEARAALGLAESDKLVVSAFGSLGAKVMNETVADMIPLAQKDNFPFRLIHATGSFGKEWMPKRVKDNGVDWENCPEIDIREYIYDMPILLNAADVVIGRAGSGTCNELGATGAPCILVPSPNVTNNHQEKNARVLEAAGGAVVMLEAGVTAEKMYAMVMELLRDDAHRAEMSRALKGLVRADSTDAICEILEELIQK
jgi:UDP-N-acetylglucosamine--N-acetylmuramyl-(pentapeptide) pyrophosphoryl-undecaprenol N-acetylglucosamine transferase